jgi:hypothetical protein
MASSVRQDTVAVTDGTAERVADAGARSSLMFVATGDVLVGKTEEWAASGYPLAAGQHFTEPDYDGEVWVQADGADVTVHVWEVG